MKYHHRTGVRTRRGLNIAINVLAILGWIIALALVLDLVFNEAGVIIDIIIYTSEEVL